MITWEILDSRTISEATLRSAYQTADAQRRQRTDAILQERNHRVSLCADWLARKMLSATLRCPPESLEFSASENGKPALVGHSFCFNLSHSGPFVICAVDAQPVGVDLECFRPVSPALPKRVCSPEELCFIGDDAHRFMQVWTLKEAFLKYKGTGIACDLKQVVVVQDGQLFLPELSFYSDTSEEYAFSIVYEQG